MNFPNSAGVIDIGSAPEPTKRDFVLARHKFSDCGNVRHFGGDIGAAVLNNELLPELLREKLANEACVQVRDTAGRKSDH